MATLILRNSPATLFALHCYASPLSRTLPSTKLFSFSITTKTGSQSLYSTKMEGSEITEELTEKTEENVNVKKKIFVAGATGNTGKRVVEQLLARGFAVKAGARDLDKAENTLSKDNPALQIVKADVTEGSAKLAEAIGDDTEAVICATGFRPGWDLFAPWKVDNFGTVNLVERAANVALVAKLQAEQYIRKSGINYTIIRPGGLRNEPPTGNVVMQPEDTLYEGTISRDQVAEVAVEALILPESSYKVVEIVAHTDAPKRSYEDLFGSIKQQ